MKSKKNKTKYSRNLKTGYADYKNMMHEFRPFVMFTNAHDHSSKIVNTDRLGFRKVFFKKKNLGLDDLKKSSNKINILLGGSTAFGSGCPSDKNTISSELSSLGQLCFSLGMRGACSHQELIAFLKFKNFFPKIKNIIILSGVNDLAMAAEKESVIYADFGGISGTRQHALNFLFQSSAGNNEKWVKGLHNLFFYINYLSQKSKIIKNILKIFSYFRQSRLTKRTPKYLYQNFNKKIKNINLMMENDLDTWSMIKKQLGVKIIYVLQPCIGWLKQPLTSHDNEILKLEWKRLKNYYTMDWTNRNAYFKQREFIKKNCEKRGIKFLDSNEIISKSYGKNSFFIDLAHLSVLGNQFLARFINRFLIK